jgi:GGDEF domain-containing protein
VIVLSLDLDQVAQVLAPDSATRGRRLLLRARPLVDPNGEITGSVCAQDLTDLHAEHVQLTRRTEELLAINRATRSILTEEDARRAACEMAVTLSGRSWPACSSRTATGTSSVPHQGVDLPGTRLPEAARSIVADVYTSGVPTLLRAAAWLPVTSCQGRCIAVLSLVFGPDTPVDEQLSVLKVLASETAVAIERQDLLCRLRQEASFDGLTEAANRRVWDEELPRALARSRQDRTPVAVVMLDLDHFKQYNDAFGHPAGDALLRDAVRAWRCQLRPGDLLCRYGGEEFVFLLPRCGSYRAQSIAEQLLVLGAEPGPARPVSPSGTGTSLPRPSLNVSMRLCMRRSWAAAPRCVPRRPLAVPLRRRLLRSRRWNAARPIPMRASVMTVSPISGLAVTSPPGSLGSWV